MAADSHFFVSICTVTPVSLVCPQTHTYTGRSLSDGMCACVSVVYCLGRFDSATPGSQCRAEAAVLAQGDLYHQPVEQAARQACCTADTLSSPPAI